MNETGLYMKKINVALERGRNRALKKYALTAPQMDTLIYLASHETRDNTLSGLADFFGVKHTSVIHVLKLLGQKELIYREEPAEGEKRKPIFLTEKGRAIVKDEKKGMEWVEGVMFDGITQEERQMLDDCLRRIYGNIVRGILTKEE